MRSLRPLLSFLGIVAMATLVYLASFVPHAPRVAAEARASHPEPLDEAIAAATTFHTAYLPVGSGGVLQVDTARQTLTFDVREGRLYWDGTDLWWHGAEAAAADQLPIAWAGRVRDVWDELRGGLEHTTF